MPRAFAGSMPSTNAICLSKPLGIGRGCYLASSGRLRNKLSDFINTHFSRVALAVIEDESLNGLRRVIVFRADAIMLESDCAAM
jgi:hypothetical protein